jgi:DNA-directed RNA polymerase specialized sigma24 family protein
VELHRTTLPLYPTDDGWPYPDVDAAEALLTSGYVAEDDIDLDALGLSADRHLFDGLTLHERALLELRYRDGTSVADLAHWFGCRRSEVVEQLADAVAKVRRRLITD